MHVGVACVSRKPLFKAQGTTRETRPARCPRPGPRDALAASTGDPPARRDYSR